jgi:HPt (histidine-containing phosphotransfer) domain-containing protein
MSEAFDRQELLDELDGDREFLEESLEVLDADAQKLIDQIRAGAEAQDAEQIRVAAHTLKSMVGNFCAPRAFEAASNVESIGRSGELSQCAERLALLESEVNRLRKELRVLLNEL